MINDHHHHHHDDKHDLHCVSFTKRNGTLPNAMTHFSFFSSPLVSPKKCPLKTFFPQNHPFPGRDGALVAMEGPWWLIFGLTQGWLIFGLTQVFIAHETGVVVVFFWMGYPP